jgi:hypothetical protein
VALDNEWNRDASFVKCLAGLEGLERERWVSTCAKWLGVAAKALREEVARAQRELAAAHSRSALAPVEPWAELVDDAMLLDELASTSRRFVFLSPQRRWD